MEEGKLEKQLSGPDAGNIQGKLRVPRKDRKDSQGRLGDGMGQETRGCSHLEKLS